MPPTPRRDRAALRQRPLVALLAAAALLLPAGCGGELSTPGESLRLLGGLPPAFLGERYDAPIETAGGLRPFRYEIVAGALPPGLALASGVVSGVPTETGEFAFTVRVSDANLSSTVQEYVLRVEETPPPELRFELPPTALRGPATVAVAARGSELRGLRTVLRWDPERLRLVEDSVRAERRDVVVLSDAAEGSLQLDIAVLGDARDGDVRLARFQLEPTPEALAAADAEAAGGGDDPGVRVGLAAATEFRARGGHSFARCSAGDVRGIGDAAPTADPDADDPLDDPFVDPDDVPADPDDPLDDPFVDPDDVPADPLDDPFDSRRDDGGAA